MKKIIFGYVLFFAVMFLLFFGNRIYLLRGSDAYKYHSDSGVSYISKVENKQFKVYDGNNSWSELFLTGVNIGAAKPGFYPGDFGISHDDYLRWFAYISDMNVSCIRVYVAQMPEFYHALAEFNGTAQHPLYLFHGIYINEADVEELYDSYADNGRIIEGFKKDIRDVVDIIHGNASVGKTTGHAGGVYTADISQYVVGLIPGIEWEAGFVLQTNANNPEKTAYDGQYLYTDGASPFEVFLAEAADTAIAYETQKYGEQRPLAISNWVTTDPLAHPNEPNPETEDAVSVNAEHIRAKENYEPGFFASYHVYPYYPDFFSYEEKYLQDGRNNTYRAYLRELNAFHTMPVLVSELGIPSARGIAHINAVSGFNQGHVDEATQGRQIAELVGDIQAEGCMGAIIFSWQDEWFKKTWNTMLIDIPDRRPFWMDYQTNEQKFGLLSFDPGMEASVSYVDGDTSEWSESDLVIEDGGRRLYAKADEQFLYLMADGVDFEGETLYIPIDTIPGQGNTSFEGLSLDNGADFIIKLSGRENSTVLVDPYYDLTYYEYAINSKIIPRDPALEKTDTGRFVPATLMISRGIYLPLSDKVIPYQTYDTGALHYGVANPSMDGFSSIADFYHKDGKVEIRLPWLLLNIIDPSEGKLAGDVYRNGGVFPEDAPPMRLSIAAPNRPGAAVWGEYMWERWGDAPTYHERLKQSYYVLQDHFAKTGVQRVVQRGAFDIFWAEWNRTAFSRVGYWFPIQPLLNYMLAFLLSVIIYFFLVLMYLHARNNVQEKRRRALREKILAALQSTLAGNSDEGAKAIGRLRLLSRNKLIVLAELFEECGEDERAALGGLLINMGYANFIGGQFRKRDASYLILLARLLSHLKLSDFNPIIVKLLYANRTNIDMQYQGLMTLSLLGAHEEIAGICLDSSFTHTLSFRSLQEILKFYAGDKSALYEKLMGSPDKFVVRICVKRIGIEGLTAYGAQLIALLECGDDNLVIDAARSLGQLKQRDAAPKLITLLAHEKWEVRSIAVEALACIDSAQYEAFLVSAIKDREWYVRYNAANALKNSPRIGKIMQEIKDSGDRYALEILQYCVEESGILGGDV